MPWLINAAQLDKFRKNQKNVLILDASYHIDGRDPKQEFTAKHIIGAQFFDIRALSDPHTDLPTMLNYDDAFISEKLGNLGVRNDCKIIFYDQSDLHSACRALWMLKVYGHNPNLLYILDGGLKAWEKYSGKIESGMPAVSQKKYAVDIQQQLVCTLEQMKAYVKNQDRQIIDVRHPVRFSGGPEMRAGLRCGHIPGSFSFPYYIIFDKEGYFLPLDKIRKKLTDIAIDLTAPITTYCGSAITASILDFVLDALEHPDHSVYDGSWSEWGAEKLYPGEHSLAERPVETCLVESVPSLL